MENVGAGCVMSPSVSKHSLDPTTIVCYPSEAILRLHPQNQSAMGMSYRQYLAGARIYGCSTCKTHLATIHSMLSRVSPCCSFHVEVDEKY